MPFWSVLQDSPRSGADFCTAGINPCSALDGLLHSFLAQPFVRPLGCIFSTLAPLQQTLSGILKVVVVYHIAIS